MTWRRLLSPSVAIAVAVALAWWMVRLEATQDARLRLEEARDSAVVVQAIAVGNSRRVTVAAAHAADRALAQLRHTESEQRARLTAAQDSTDRLQTAVESALARLEAPVAAPIRAYVDGLQTQVRSLETLLDLAYEVADTLQADRDRWRKQAQDEEALSAAWRRRAEAWKDVSKGCRIPLVGLKCPVLVIGPSIGTAKKAELSLTFGFRP